MVLCLLPLFRGDAPVMGHVWEAMVVRESENGFVLNFVPSYCTVRSQS